MGDESTIQPMLTPAQVARLFAVDPKTVSRWARSGRIPAKRTPGGHHRFRQADVNELLEREAPAAVASVDAGDACA